VEAGVLWPLIFGRVKSKLAAAGLRRGVACSLWCGVWVSGGETNITATQQGAATDRRQFGSFCSVSALLLVGRNWAAAGELSRSVACAQLEC